MVCVMVCVCVRVCVRMHVRMYAPLNIDGAFRRTVPQIMDIVEKDRVVKLAPSVNAMHHQIENIAKLDHIERGMRSIGNSAWGSSCGSEGSRTPSYWGSSYSPPATKSPPDPNAPCDPPSKRMLFRVGFVLLRGCTQNVYGIACF